MNYLITGGLGFIGSRVAMQTRGDVYDLKTGLDILNESELVKKAQNVNGIFHLAAKISVPESFVLVDEYYKVNVEGTKKVVKTASALGVKIVFSSSAAVYGDSDVIVDENSSLNPKSPYAENKLEAERILSSEKIPHIALRYFNVYGPGQSPQYAGVITAFISNAIENKDIVIYGDGKQIRDFIFVDDVARANVAAMQYKNDSFEVFNIASGEETSINELAQIVIELTKSKSKIVHKEARLGDIKYSRANVSKAKKYLNWSAQTTLRDGLEETIHHYRKFLVSQ